MIKPDGVVESIGWWLATYSLFGQPGQSSPVVSNTVEPGPSSAQPSSAQTRRTDVLCVCVAECTK